MPSTTGRPSPIGPPQPAELARPEPVPTGGGALRRSAVRVSLASRVRRRESGTGRGRVLPGDRPIETTPHARAPQIHREFRGVARHVAGTIGHEDLLQGHRGFGPGGQVTHREGIRQVSDNPAFASVSPIRKPARICP